MNVGAGYCVKATADATIEFSRAGHHKGPDAYTVPALGHRHQAAARSCQALHQARPLTKTFNPVYEGSARLYHEESSIQSAYIHQLVYAGHLQVMPDSPCVQVCNYHMAFL